MISPPYYFIIIFLIVVSYYNVKLFYYRINNLLFDHENMWAIHLCSYIIILIYYYMIILLCYFLICWYSHSITLSDIFFHHYFCSRTVLYHRSGIIKRSSKHRISAHTFSMCSKTKIFVFFRTQGPWGPGPWSPWAPQDPNILRSLFCLIQWPETYLEVFLGV